MSENVGIQTKSKLYTTVKKTKVSRFWKKACGFTNEERFSVEVPSDIDFWIYNSTDFIIFTGVTCLYSLYAVI